MWINKSAIILTMILPLTALAVDKSAVKAESYDQNDKQYLEKFMAVTPNLKNGKLLFEACALCHSPEGWGNKSGRFPHIASQHFSVIIKQLEDIRRGNRDNPTMFPFAAFEDSQGGLQDMVDVATYISKLPMARNNSHGDGRHLSGGKKLYKENCVKCHGEIGEGLAKKYYPRISGQHYQYLLRQMRWIKSNKRRNADVKMRRQIEHFRDHDLKVIADYVSRLKPDDKLLAKDDNWRNEDFDKDFHHAQKENN